MIKEQVALQGKLQAHVQTVDIPLSRKAELQPATADAQSSLLKADESEKLAIHLKYSRQRESRCGLRLPSWMEQHQVDKYNKELNEELDALRLESKNKSIKHLKLQNSERQERLRILRAENVAMYSGMEETSQLLL